MEYVALMGNTRKAYKILVGKLEDADHVEHLGLHWRIILRWSLKNNVSVIAR
jgi:hypothetical protein